MTNLEIVTDLRAETPEALRADRKNIIKSACQRIAALEAKRAEISAQINEIKQSEIKGKLAMKIADFNGALRLHKLGRDERDEYMETLRETFAALGVGAQLDWVYAAEKEGQSARRDAAEAADRATDRATDAATDNLH